MFEKLINRLARNEDGAVTVDWVVLTAAVVILAIGAIATLNVAVDNLLTSINFELVWSNISNAFVPP